jgi:hypothetical protein
MKLFNDVAAQLQKYYLERNVDALHEVERLVATELTDPELQEAFITLPERLDEIEELINVQGFLRVGLDAGESSGPVVEGKFIRLFSQAESEDGCMVLNVAHIDDTQIIMVPSGGSV